MAKPQEKLECALLSKKQVARRLGVCVRTVDRYRALPQFPAPLRLPHGHLRWRVHEIDAYLDSLPRLQRQAQAGPIRNRRPPLRKSVL